MSVNQPSVKKEITLKINIPQKLIEQSIQIPKFKDSPLDAQSSGLGYSLGKGGYGEAYLYWSNKRNEYRVLKQFHTVSEMNRLGGIKRKQRVFNEYFNNIYGGKFCELASARVLIGANNEQYLDMPYLQGDSVDFGAEGLFSEEAWKNKEHVMSDLGKSGFYLRDYEMDGNIVTCRDEGKRYFLVRDIDELASRSSFIANEQGESVSHKIGSDIQNEEDKKFFAKAMKNQKQPQVNHQVQQSNPQLLSKKEKADLLSKFQNKKLPAYQVKTFFIDEAVKSGEKLNIHRKDSNSCFNKLKNKLNGVPSNCTSSMRRLLREAKSRHDSDAKEKIIIRCGLK